MILHKVRFKSCFLIIVIHYCLKVNKKLQFLLIRNALNVSEVTVKTFIMLQMIQINAVLLNFIFICES